MSFFKKLFGGGSSGADEAASEPVEYEGFQIVATPMKEGGQFRLCGVISKDVDGERKEHKLIRADLLTSVDECTEFTIRKARQVIDEQGERLFR